MTTTAQRIATITDELVYQAGELRQRRTTLVNELFGVDAELEQLQVALDALSGLQTVAPPPEPSGPPVSPPDRGDKEPATRRTTTKAPRKATASAADTPSPMQASSNKGWERIADLLADGTPRTVAEIAKLAGCTDGTTRVYLGQLKREGRAEKRENGRWAALGVTPLKGSGVGDLGPISKTPVDEQAARARAAGGV